MVESDQSTGQIPVAGLVELTNRRMQRPLTEKRIENALRIVANIIAEGEHQYLPIFLRLESELASCKEKTNAIERAKSFSSQKLET